MEQDVTACGCVQGWNLFPKKFERGFQCFAQQQARYIVGTGWQRKSFIVGIAEDRGYNRITHHGASCPPWPQKCPQNMAASDQPDANVILGGLIWAPEVCPPPFFVIFCLLPCAKPCSWVCAGSGHPQPVNLQPIPSVMLPSGFRAASVFGCNRVVPSGIVPFLWHECVCRVAPGEVGSRVNLSRPARFGGPPLTQFREHQGCCLCAA